MADFQLYNLIFCKNELMLDDYKVAVVMDILWKLLEFSPDGNDKIDVKNQEIEAPAPEGVAKHLDPNNVNPDKAEIDFRGDGIDVEREFKAAFDRKFALLKHLIMR